MEYDYMAEALNNICSLSFHWSSDCNMACKYCYIEKEKNCMASYNREIREALRDGSYAANVKRVMASRREIIENLSLWGAEPTINGDLFKNFIYELLDYFPNVNSFMFSTNALVGAERIYRDFFQPLVEYAEKHHRKMKFDLQLSLDGPPEFNDDSRHPGAAKNTMETARLMAERFPKESPWFELNLLTKPTLDISYMRIMNERGLESFIWYYKFFNDLQKEVKAIAADKPSISVNLTGIPTLVDPGYYTVQDGKDFATWINFLKKVPRTEIPEYNHVPLFTQGISGFEHFLNNRNPAAIGFHAFSCSASKNNITIDHKGTLFTCNRLCRNSALSDRDKTKHAMQSGTNLKTTDKQWVRRTWGAEAFHHDLISRRFMQDITVVPMALAGQILPKYGAENGGDDRTILFMACCGIYCHIGIEEDYTQNPSIVPTSYIRLWGNGGIDALIEYYNIEIARGEIQPWNIVM